jgi:hypothetical protein
MRLIEVFLNDLRLEGSEHKSATSFFNSLNGLSVGPIRALASGSCSIRDLDVVIQDFFGETTATPAWRERFDCLGDNISL